MWKHQIELNDEINLAATQKISSNCERNMEHFEDIESITLAFNYSDSILYN